MNMYKRKIGHVITAGIYQYQPINTLGNRMLAGSLDANMEYIGHMPLKKVDPKGVYCFVIGSDGETYTALKTEMRLKRIAYISTEVSAMATANQVKQAEINAMIKTIKI